MTHTWFNASRFSQVRYFLITGFMLFCLILSAARCSGQNTKKIDSLLLEESRRESDNDSVKFNILFGLFVEHIGIDNKRAIYYADRSLATAMKLGDSLKIAESLHGRGDMRMETGDILAGINDMKKALAISERNKFRKREKFLLNNLALAYTLTVNYDSALEYNFRTLKLREEERDYKPISISYNNIGLVYLELKTYDNALSYFQKSIALAEKAGDLSGVEIALTNIGYCYGGLGDYNRAVKSYYQALEVCGSKCKTESIILIYHALGSGFIELNKFSLAQEYLIKSTALAQEINSAKFEVAGLSSLAEIKMHQDDLDDALEILGRSIDIANNGDLKAGLLQIYQVYMKIYEKKSDFEMLSRFQKKYIELNQEIYNGDLIKNALRIQTNYAERENLETIAKKDQVLLLQEEIIASQRWQYISAVVIAVLSVGLTLVMFRINHIQKRINKILDSRVQERTKELVARNHELASSVLAQESVNARIADQIRATKATLLGLIHTANKDLADNPKAEDYLKKMRSETDKLDLEYSGRAIQFDR